MSQSSRASSSFSIEDAGAASWGRYIIDIDSTPLNAAPTASADYDVLGSAFEDIGAVGYFFEQSRADESGNLTHYVDQFQFAATAIPEPSSIALLLGGVGLALVVSRRLNK